MLIVYFESHHGLELALQIPWRFAASVPGRELEMRR
jgi:hypothetical protein